MRTVRRLRLFVVAPIFVATWFPCAGLGAQDSYRRPPDDIVAIVDARPAPSLDFSPDSEHVLVIESDAMPSIADVSRRMLRLAGMRIDPGANARHRTSFDAGLSVREWKDSGGERAVRVPLPEGARLADASWSHDSEHFFFTLVTGDGTELWAATAGDAASPRKLSDRVNTVMGGPSWMPDGRTILFREVPATRDAEPEAPSAPSAPNIQSTSGNTSPLRTYQDLLANPHDAALFVHYATTSVVLVSADSGDREVIGDPALFGSVRPSPSGEFLLVTRLEQPFSYLMPHWNFARTIEVWDRGGKVVETVAELPLAENVPIGGVPIGPRSVAWRTGAPATLVWVEALDGGDPDREVAHRDRYLSRAVPFDGEAIELVYVEHRAWGMTFLADPDEVIVSEYDRDRRWTRSSSISLSGARKARILDDRSIRDRYTDPGSIVHELDASGRAVPIQDGPWVYRIGSGASPEGLLPFLDRQNLETLATERLWRCSPGSYEAVVDVLHGTGGATTFITRHETETTPPNYRLRSLASDDVAPLSDFPDPTPQIRGIKKQLVTYEREDGLPLSATMYLPADYEPGTRLPLFVWAYPREFNDRATAAQVTSSPSRFTRIRGTSHLALLTQGYAVMDGATMPVVGDPETMNDTFVEQIVAAAAAAIDKAVEMGVADSERVAIGGHSYGAFMTANLLAHSDLFRAGIARSGAYNRSLTPFGFQSERRTFWEAPDAYFRVSPFMHVDDINEPLLMIHGEIDNNSGTFPMQSKRMFQAIKGHGGTARLVMLPNESHGYRARESVLHVLAEMVEWLDLHVKGDPE